MVRAEFPIGVVLPVRSFTEGLTRLGGRLTPEERAAFAQACATRVVQAAHPHPIVVVSNAAEVREWAQMLGIAVIGDPGTLNAAARTGQEHWRAHGAHRTVVLHADLPRITSVAPLVAFGARRIASLVPCHHDDGTPALSVPTDVDFAFAYGPDSFRAHLAAAIAADLSPHIVRTPELRFDVDTPGDLDQLDSIAAAAFGA